MGLASISAIYHVSLLGTQMISARGQLLVMLMSLMHDDVHILCILDSGISPQPS